MFASGPACSGSLFAFELESYDFVFAFELESYDFVFASELESCDFVFASELDSCDYEIVYGGYDSVLTGGLVFWSEPILCRWGPLLLFGSELVFVLHEEPVLAHDSVFAAEFASRDSELASEHEFDGYVIAHGCENDDSEFALTCELVFAT